MNEAQVEAIAQADVYANNAGLPTYSALADAIEKIANAAAWDDGYDPLAAAARFQEIAKKARQ